MLRRCCHSFLCDKVAQDTGLIAWPTRPCSCDSQPPRLTSTFQCQRCFCLTVFIPQRAASLISRSFFLSQITMACLGIFCACIYVYTLVSAAWSLLQTMICAVFDDSRKTSQLRVRKSIARSFARAKRWLTMYEQPHTTPTTCPHPHLSTALCHEPGTAQPLGRQALGKWDFKIAHIVTAAIWQTSIWSLCCIHKWASMKSSDRLSGCFVSFTIILFLFACPPASILSLWSHLWSKTDVFCCITPL